MGRRKIISAFWPVSVVVAGILFAFTNTLSGQHQRPQTSGQQEMDHAYQGMTHGDKEKRVPPYYKNVEDLKEIPKTLPPGQFGDTTTRKAFEVARDNPKLLLQLPCFCFCDRPEIGHKSLLDCYVGEHAATCNVCTSEALLAAKLAGENWSVEKIRNKIIADHSDMHGAH